MLSDPKLYALWLEELKEMSNRIKECRKLLFDELKVLGTPGDWSHIVTQIGMFSYTGLTRKSYIHTKQEPQTSWPQIILCSALLEGQEILEHGCIDDLCVIHTAEQCERMISQHHIYLLKTGRISMAGINKKNVKYLADAIHEVVTHLAKESH